MFNKLTITNTFTAVALSVTLAACGGGGGGGLNSSATEVASFSAVCADLSTQSSTISQADAQGKCPVASTILNASLPVASSYAANGLTEELAVFNLLNSERSRCGFGTLKQNVTLDAAAKAHADWQNLNNSFGHIETTGTTGFTGVGVFERIAANGNYGAVGDASDDLTNFGAVISKVGLGLRSVRGLLNAPYHMRGLLGNYRDAGIAVRTSGDVGTAFNTAVVQYNFAYSSGDGGQLPNGSDVLTYPCAGTTGTDRQLTNESPNPVPGRDLSVNPLGGSIYIAVRPGNTLAITSASLISLSSGSAVALRTPVVAFGGPANEGYVAADAPMLANTTYQATINGTNNSTAFSRTFTFTTGAGG